MDTDLHELLNEYYQLPKKGYISEKIINGKKYHYFQYLENGKLISKYIKKDEYSAIKRQIERRKELESIIKKYEDNTKNISIPTNNSNNLSGYLMMADTKIAEFKNGVLISSNEKLLPYLIKRTRSLTTFLESRAIDTGRTNSRLLRKALGIRETEKSKIVLYAHGASITDNYWFKTKGSKLKYKDISFDNDFYSELALEGKLNLFPRKPKLTPQLTLGGSYEKCWKKEDNEWWLYKKGNKNEIFSELFCSKLAYVLGIPSAQYEHVNTTIRTKNFAKEYNYEPVLAIAGDDDNYDNVFNSLNSLSSDLAKSYIKLVWFDCIVKNVDRHNENCGFLRDKKNGKIVSLAPNFDNNLALISMNEKLDLDVKKDGFIKMFMDFISNNEIAKEYYIKMIMPKLTKEMIVDCLESIDIKKDDEMIIKYILNRYELLKSFKINL